MSEVTQAEGATLAPEAPAAESPQNLTEFLIDGFTKAVDEKGKKAYATWGMALFHTISDEKAHVYLSQLGIEPKDALDFYNQGCALATAEKFKDAAKAFAKAVELDENLTEARHNLALAHEKAGNVPAAKEAWTELARMLTNEEEAAEIRQHIKEL